MAPRRPQLDRGANGSSGRFTGYTDKYRNITNANTVRGVINRGGPLTGSASGVRSISSVDAFNSLGQFFIGEAIGVPVAAGFAKIIGRVLPRAARVAGAGVRPMTTAERSAAVTRAGRNGVGKIGKSIKQENPYNGENWTGDFMEPFDSYDSAYWDAAKILESRGKVSPDKLVPVSGRLVNTRYRGFTQTVNIPDAYEDPFGYGGGSGGVDFDMITGAMKKTLDWKATRAPLRRTASVKPRTRR